MVKLVMGRLINCQSHQDTTYNFSSGLNIFRAEKNSAGKSVFFKMIKLVGNPGFLKTEEERRQYIAHGAEFATAMFVFSDDSVGMIRVYPKQIVYYYTADHKSIGLSSYTFPPQEFIDALALITDTKSKFIANVLDMDQEMLFVKSDGITNNDLVTLLTTNEQLDRMLDLCERKVKEYKEYKKYLVDTTDRLEIQLSRYSYVSTTRLEEAIVNVESALVVYEGMVDVFKEIESAAGCLVKDIDYDTLITACSIYEELKPAIEAVSSYEMKEFNESLLDAVNLYAQVENVVKSAKSVKVVTTSSVMGVYETLLDIAILASDIKQVKDNKDAILAIDLYDAVSSAVHQCKMLYNYNQSSIKAFENSESIMAELNELGRRVPCVIYGEVQHIDGECIPIES